MKRLIYILAAALTAVSASADDLNKEITVEKEIVPQEREASRLNRLPQLSLPPVQARKLKWTDRAVAAPITNNISVLSPATYAASIARSPYRGYLDLGYFPSMQIGASAGYSFIDSEMTRLGAWLQYDGSQYKRENIVGNKLDYRDHSAALGVNLAHRFDEIGTLTARAAYSFSAFNFPTLVDKGLSQSANRFDLGVGWESTLDALSYNVSLDYNYFGFSKAVEEQLKAMGENTARLSLGGLYSFTESHNVGADINLAVNSVSKPVFIDDADYSLANIDSKNLGYVNFAPYYLNRGDNYSLRLGLEVNYIWGADNGVRIHPDVRFDWTPGSKFGLYARFSGGNPQLNAISTLFKRDHYINPSIMNAPSWNKYMADLGFIIGPFSGASIEVWGGLGKVASLPLPTVIEDGEFPQLMGSYAAIDYTSIHYGIALNYTYRDIARLRVAYEGAPQDLDRGYMYWLDRARNVLGASLTVTPVKPLDLELSYTLRSGRATYSVAPDDVPFDHLPYAKVSLGNAGSLNFGASYRVNPQFSVWARGENLLNSKWQEVFAVPCKGVTGLIGIGYKF